MTQAYSLRGLELRYMLTTLLADAGRPLDVSELAEALISAGYALSGRPGKTISEPLRWEIGRGRVVRVGMARYRAGTMPRQTKSRICARVRAVADAAGRLRLADAFASSARTG